MNRFDPERYTGIALLSAIGAAGVSLYVGPQGDLAVPAAIVAVLSAAAFASLKLFAGTVRRPLGLAVPESSRLVLLRDAFRSGPFGRQTVVSTLEGLRREMGVRANAIGPEEARRAVNEMPVHEFREWVGRRLTELEEGS
ncbi:MAG: hypothetical protein L3K09_02670 [Thermoplasmata archaeon]|nr:hypothetical protein [Thermoplasmata archaeon]